MEEKELRILGREPLIRISKKEFSTLYNLTGLDGALVTNSLLMPKFLSKDIEDIIFTGPPGGGKSIISSQVTTLLRQMGFVVELIEFDHYRREREIDTGIEPRYWKPEDWNSFSTDLYSEISKGKLRNKKPINRKRVIELPAVGSESELDVGISTVYFLIDDDWKLNDPSTLVVPIIADPRNQSKSGDMRERFRLDYFKDFSRVIPILQEEFNTYIVWEGKKPDSLEEEGILFLGMLDKMAQKRAINRVNAETKEEVRKMLRQEGKMLTVSNLPSISPSYDSGMKFDAKQFIQIQIYYQKRMMEMLQNIGLPKENGEIIFNRFTQNPVYLHLRQEDI